MKKLLIIGLTALGALSFSGCDYIKQFMNKTSQTVEDNKSMKCEEFLREWEGNDAAEKYMYAYETDSSTKDKVVHDYEFNPETYQYVYNLVIDFDDGTSATMPIAKYFDAYHYVQNLKQDLQKKNQNIDDVYTFSKYKVSMLEAYGSIIIEFNSEGLMKSLKGRYGGESIVDYSYKYEEH